VDPAKPSLGLLRSLTDEHVLRTLMRHRRLTRAELAAGTGISKPTVGESVRRLAEAGLVADTGQRTTGGRGRGRVGSYYALAGDIGVALAVSIAPEGIAAECVDAYGDTVWQGEEKVGRPARAEQVAGVLRTVVARAACWSRGGTGPSRGGTGPLPRLAVVSAADPVDRATGRLIHLPDAPFLLGELDPVPILAPHVTGPVTVDNDVNWAARAERDQARTTPLDDFGYLFLGEGLGGAIISDGQVRRGHHGLAGEVAHLSTTGPGGRAMPFTEVFSELGLRRPGTAAIDVDRLLAAVTGQEPGAAAIRHDLGQAISGVLAAIVALADPELVIVGGSWGRHPVILDTIITGTARLRRQVPVRGAELSGTASLDGARSDAVSRLRSEIIGLVHAPGGG
jgi:predicted NBD/HSP70 family sugar kinase